MSPVQPDIIGKEKPSDHNTPFSESIINWNNFTQHITKPSLWEGCPNLALKKFGQWIIIANFENIYTAKTSTGKVNILQDMIQSKVEQIFPLKTIKVFNRDKEWMTEELKLIRRQKVGNTERTKNQINLWDFIRNF